MAYLKRHLILLAAAFVAVSFAALSVRAQTDAAPPPSFRTLGVGSSTATASLFFEDKGKAVPLIIDSHGLSPAYPVPASGIISLFRQAPPASPGEPPRRIPVAETRIAKSGPALLALVAAPNGSSSPRVNALSIDDSQEAHPSGSARVFNFSRRTVALQTSSGPVELPSGASHIVPYPEKSRVIDLKIAIREKGNWLLCSTSPQGIIPKTRMIVVVADDDPTPDNPSPVEPVLNTIYDTSLPPVPATSVVRASSAAPAKLASAR
jgi:hypothetical protein